MDINISENFKVLFPDYVSGIIDCKVTNSITSDQLWTEMENEIEKIRANFKIEDINKRIEIKATRDAYKKLGKDPNRYRPSAEALCRRIVRGIPVYKVNTLVDIINIVSIRSGFSIGAFDKSKIQGDLVLDAGRSDDIFEAIGRGLMNIEGLPVYRDNIGGIGTPTSDNERTKITMETQDLLVIINSYSGHAGIEECIDHCVQLLEQFAKMTDITTYSH